MSATGHEQDFTEQAYRALVKQAKQRYEFLPFDRAAPADNGVLWRHDIDMSVHRALALAKIEHDEGVRATYFVHLHSRFYNALEDAIVERLRAIVALGHDLGVHFDSRFLTGAGTIEQAVAAERVTIEQACGAKLTAVSFHDPDVTTVADAAEIAGLVNAYGKSLRERFEYASDSNGYWRFKPLSDVLATAGPRLQVLTHPEWWVPEPMPPRARVMRAIEGRAAYLAAKYDAAMKDVGRDNIR